MMKEMIKLIIDKDIPFIKGVFEPYAEVVYLKGSEIDNNAVRDASGLIIRTRTKCDSKLLAGSSVRFIATATIGTDHIDSVYCASEGIETANAAGCNSGAVMQYVYTALFAMAHSGKIDLKYGTLSDAQTKRSVIGIIGAGNVGGKIAGLGEYLGFKVLRNDPPKELLQTMAFNRGLIRVSDFVNYYSLDYVLENSDIVTLHVPLSESTINMADSVFFSKMKERAVFINTSRGEVVDERALIGAREKLSALILDVWRNEPAINPELVTMADIATPHIAGYSLEGKVNGTVAAIRATAVHFGIDALAEYEVPHEIIDGERQQIDLYDNGIEENWKILSGIFPIFDTDAVLRNNISDFEKIRSQYNLRREFYVNTTG